MTLRVTSDLLLVGSLPADSTESAFRAGARHFGDLVFALPDGETGPRAAGWATSASSSSGPTRTSSSSRRPRRRPAYRGMRTRRRCSRCARASTSCTGTAWPRIDDAIESYATFTRLRDEGVIPAGLRFQIGLPFPSSALNAFKADFARDYPKAERGFEDLVARELARLTEAIPPADLAIQWDNAYETQDIEGVLAWTSDGAWERFAGPVSRLTRLIPEEVLVGYHLCYGTFPEWPMYEAQDMSVLVRMANFAIAESGRPVDWLHLAGPRYLRSEDERFFRPLQRPRRPRHARVPRHRAADRRDPRPAPPPRDGEEVPRRLRRGHVLRVRPAARS